MFKSKLNFFAALVLIAVAGAAYADVVFLPGDDSSVGSGGSGYVPSDPAKKCLSSGYTIQSCNAGYKLSNPCPHHRSYYKSCCPEEYSFTKEECERENMRASRDSCGGLYKCL